MSCSEAVRPSLTQLLDSSATRLMCISVPIMCITCEMMCTRNCRVGTTDFTEDVDDILRKSLGRALRNSIGDITVCFIILNMYNMRNDVYSKLSGEYYGSTKAFHDISIPKAIRACS